MPKKETRGGPRPNTGPKPTVPNGKRFNLYLNPDDVDRVRETGQPISKFVREAIAEKLERLTLT